MSSSKGAALDLWQRQAVLAAAALLRERFGLALDDTKAKAVHDALLEVVEPTRRALRVQREMAKPVAATVLTAKERRGRPRDRRTGWERRVLDVGGPGGVDRRTSERRVRNERRAGRR